MSDIFSGLESMGLVGLSSVNIYEEEKPRKKQINQALSYRK